MCNGQMIAYLGYGHPTTKDSLWAYQTYYSIGLGFHNSSGWWFQPLWKIWVSWDDYSQSMEKSNSCSSHHQPVMVIDKTHNEDLKLTIPFDGNITHVTAENGHPPCWSDGRAPSCQDPQGRRGQDNILPRVQGKPTVTCWKDLKCWIGNGGRYQNLLYTCLCNFKHCRAWEMWSFGALLEVAWI